MSSFLFSLFHIKCNLCLHILLECGLLLKCGGPARIYLLKWRGSPSHCHRQLPTAPRLWWDFLLPFHPHVGIFLWLEVVQVLYTLLQVLQVQMRNCPTVFRRLCLLVVIYHLRLLQFFLPLFPMITPSREGCVLQMCLFRAEHSSFSYFLHLDQLWFFELIATNWKKRLICWGLRDTI